MVKNGKVSDDHNMVQKRSRKILAKEFKRGNFGYKEKLSQAFD